MDGDAGMDTFDCVYAIYGVYSLDGVYPTSDSSGSGDAVAGVYGMVEVELLFRLLVSWESNFGLGEKEEEEIVGRDGADGGVWCLEGPANDN